MKLKRFVAFFMLAVMIFNIIKTPVSASANSQDKINYENNTDYVQLTTENFPDNTFRESLSREFDEDGDTWIYIPDVKSIGCVGGPAFLVDNNIKSLKGIEYFTYLEVLDCSYNEITELDLTQNVNLKVLLCRINELTSLDVSKCTKIELLECDNNNLTNLDLSNNKNLKYLHCHANDITNLNLNGLTQLETLICFKNELTNLIIPSSKLGTLSCSDNNLTSLDLSLCRDSLQSLQCQNNDITNLSVANMPNLDSLYVSIDKVKKIDITNAGFDSSDATICLYSDVGSGIVDTSKIVGLDGFDAYKDIAGKKLTFSHKNSQETVDDYFKNRAVFNEIPESHELYDAFSLYYRLFAYDASLGVWDDNSSGTRSFYVNGTLIKDAWAYGQDGNLRYLDSNGNISQNTFKDDGTYTYYLQYDGSPMKDRLTYHPDGIHVIYFDSQGHEVFSDFANVRTTIEGNPVDDYCFFDVYGYLYVDVVTYDKEGKNLYYANPYGVLERGKWFQFSDTVMCADGTPWNGAAGNFGYANADGTLMVNTYTYDWEGRLCYMQGNGVALY